MVSFAGLIFAAGLSTRMGRTKALLPFGDNSLIVRQIKCFLGAGVEDIFIVTGHDAKNVEAEAGAYPVKIVYNTDYKLGMFSSVKAGLREVMRGGTRAVYLLPADCALVTPRILIALAKAYNEGEADIVYPCHHGRKGHPPLISSCLINSIMQYDGEGGVKAALSGLRGHAAFVESGAGCLFDIDTKKDYSKALKLLNIKKRPKALVN